MKKTILTIILIVICQIIISQKFTLKKEVLVEKLTKRKNWSTCPLNVGSKIRIYDALWYGVNRTAIRIGNCTYIAYKTYNSDNLEYQCVPLESFNLNSWKSGMPNVRNGELLFIIDGQISNTIISIVLNTKYGQTEVIQFETHYYLNR